MLKTLLSTLALTSCLMASNQTVDIYTEHYPPYNMKENGKLTGLAVEVLDAMFKQMKSSQNIEQVKLTNWSRAYTIAQKKPNAMVFSTTRTESRENLFKWVGPIVKSKIGVIAPKAKNIKINSIKDFEKYKIGAVLKDAGETLLLDHGVNKKQIQHVLGKNAINLSFTKMEKNRIDMFAYDTNVAFMNAKQNGFDTDKYEIIYTLKDGELYFAFNKNTDDAIIKQWQSALDAIKKAGLHQKILRKYK